MPTSNATSSAAPDFRNAVARQFADYPTLRQVASRQLLALLTERHPLLRRAEPSLTSAEPLRLLSPEPARDYRHNRAFLDVLLQALFDGAAINFAPVNGRGYFLALAEPYRFPDTDDAFQALALEDLGQALDELLLLLPEYLCQAQVEYWREQGSAGVGRDRWLRQLLRTALLNNLPLQGLDMQQQALVRDVLADTGRKHDACVVEACLELGDEHFETLLPGLLLLGEWDRRQVVLWCSPSSQVRAFDSLDDFALALRDELGERYRFDAMRWNRYALEGDVFAQQVALLLDIMLDRVRRARFNLLGNPAEMEQLFTALCDPAQWFIEGYIAAGDVPIPIPPGLASATAFTGFAYQSALFELTLEQANLQGQAALGEIQDLKSYAKEQLRQHLLADYPHEANYFSDDLLLELSVAHGMPGGAGAGAGGGEPLKAIGVSTLTDFAIGNLSSLRGALITAVRHRTGQLIQPWLTVDYLKNLVTRVDIGGRYPRYVAQCLDDPAERPQRAQRFARQWRCSLLFSALSAHLEGTLSEVALQCVSNYCAGHINPEVPDLTLMPLAFKRQPNSAIHDQVSAMYVLFSATPARVVLYRPLYGSTALREFTGLEALLAAICEDGPLQHSVLDWMPAHARAIYADGGFREPHISHLGPDPLDVPERPKPASLATRFWLDDVDERLYSANRDLLVELAGLQSTSNAESRWALLREGAWLLFDVVTVVLTGPVATIAWLVQLIESVNRDVESFTQGTEFERSAAVVDALLNLGMMLLHARLPSAPLPRATRLAHASSFPATLARGNAGAPLEVLPSQGKVGLPGSLRALEHRPLDFSWRGGRGFNRLTHQQREAIVGMRRDPGRTGLVAETSGSAKGLYKVDGRYYATLEGDFYPARVLEEGVRIMDEQGAFGPWLVFEHGAWRVDDGLRLRGGMPKTRRELLVQKNSEELQALNAREKELIRMLNEQGDKFKQHRELLLKRAQEIQALEQSTDNLQLDQLVLVRRLHQRIRLEIAKDLKNLVYIGLEHNQVLSDIAARRRNDATLEYALATQRNNTRQDLIEHCESYYNYLAKLINDENPGALGESLVVHPETEAEIRHYRDFRASLERVVEWQAELSELAGRFDDLLEDTLNDHTIVFKAEGESEGEADNRRVKETWVRNIIEQRRLTDVDVQFRQLLDLGELSLDRLASVEERVLEEYADYLVGEDLKSAGAAHGELTGSGLSVTECIEVLGGVHDAYEQAAAMSDYLLSLGGVAVRGESLQAYKRVLANLKESAERSLEASMREKELAEPRVSKPALYPSRGGKRRVAKTHRGRSVVVEEVEVDGAAVVQQRDFRTKQVLKTFRQEGGGWVEQDAHPTSSKLPWSPLADPVKDTRRADELLAQVDSIMSLGKQYISSDEPLGFETVIEGQIDKMQHARGKLVRTPESEALLDSLDKGIERLQLFRRDQLTTFHFSTTHPTANSLRFLHDAQAITVQRVGKRKKTASDYLQVYDVRRKGSGEGLWQVHLHYPGMETPPREFSKGHIKLWSQLSIGRDVQVRLARRKDMKAIYRGDLRLADIDGLIPLA